MADSEIKIPAEVPRDPVRILGEVGVTPEHLQGRTVVYFGKEIDALRNGIEGATFITPDMQHFFETNELLPSDHPADMVLVGSDDYLQSPPGNSDREDLLAAVVQATKVGGEIRIANPVINPNTADHPQRIQEQYEMLLAYNYGLPITASYVIRQDEPAYVLLMRLRQE